MKVGIIKQIWRYPVKSMAGEQLDSSSVGNLGLPGDRGWAVRDETTREITNGKHFPLLMQSSAKYREAPTAGVVSHARKLRIKCPICFISLSVSAMQLPENVTES